MKYNSEQLRKKAQELLKEKRVLQNPELLEDIEKLIEDYNVHKIELELQQEELSKTNHAYEIKNQQLDDLFENAPVGYFILDRDGYIQKVNKTACMAFGQAERFFGNKPFHQFIHSSSQDLFYFYWQGLMAGKNPDNIEVAMVCDQKEAGYFLLTGLVFEDAEKKGSQVRLSAINVSDTKKAEALRDSERRYRLLFKNMINGLLVLKPVFTLKDSQPESFNFFRANASFEQMRGITAHDMEGAPLMHVFPDNGGEILEMLRKTVVTGKNQHLENILIKEDLYINMYSFIPEEGYVALILEDVTARLLAEKEKEKSKELLQTIFKILPVGVTVTNSSGSIIDCNPASEELLGLKKEEHLVRNFAGAEWRIIRPDLSPMPPTEFASVRALKENRIVENVEMGIVKEKDQVTWINVSAAPIPMPDMGVAIVYSDITERVLAQEETEEKFMNIIQNSADAILIVNREGTIIEWNKGCEQIFRYRKKTVLGQKVWSFISNILVAGPASAEKSLFGEENIKHALAKGESPWFRKINETEIRDACGKEKAIQSVAFPVKSANGFLMGVIARDITETKETERMLKIAKENAEEASQIKSQFLANISHEIRTPLNAIMGFTEILKEFSFQDSRFETHLAGIEKSGKALMALINDILDLSRIEAGKMSLNPSSFNIQSLVEDVKQIFSLKASQKGLEFTISISGELYGEIVLDELRLRQILFNLVGNAVKFTQKGSVAIEVLTLKKQTLNNAIDLIINVLDTGPGIAPRDLEAIFEPFYQKNPQAGKLEGTGLGLAISRRFAEMMNGQISVSSRVEKGTIFTLFIPNVPVKESIHAPVRKKPLESMPDSRDLPQHKALVEKILNEVQVKEGSKAKAHSFLRKKVWKEYDKIADILGFDEMISFSSMLADLAKKHQLEYLGLFAEKLSREANSFNVIEINRMFAALETIRK